MKIQILRRLTFEKLKRALPTRLKKMASFVNPHRDEYALIIFSSDEDDTISSSQMQKAVKKLNPPSSEHLVAAGWNFTEEAMAIVKMHRGDILRISEFYWTDGRLQRVRTPNPKKLK